MFIDFSASRHCMLWVNCIFRHCMLLLLHIKKVLYMQVGDESFDSYSAEKDGILSSLARRAKVSKLT